jgi:hypothetical protein
MLAPEITVFQNAEMLKLTRRPPRHWIMAMNSLFRVCIPLLLVSTVGVLGCGQSSRELQSITITSPGDSGTESILKASGTFSLSPTNVSPLPVSWYAVGPGLPQPSAVYSLTSQRFVLGCGAGIVAVALAPTAPNAPTSGSVPSQVFRDLVLSHTLSTESGYVSATIPALPTC